MITLSTNESYTKMAPLPEECNIIEKVIGEDNRILDVKIEEEKEADIVEVSIDKQLKQEESKTNDNDDGKRRRSEVNISVSLMKQVHNDQLKHSVSMPQIHDGKNNSDTISENKMIPAGVSASSIMKSAKVEVITKEGEELDLSNPHHLLLHYLRNEGYEAQTHKSLTLTDFFLELQDVHIESYNTEIVKAVRDRNIALMRSMHDNGQLLQCCNRFGESLLHMACRRGYTDVVRYLIEEADVTLRVKDDFGRTPLHDACWSATPNFDLMELILKHDPDLLLVEDIRGHTPFTYARKSHWKEWNDFLTTNRQSLRLKTFP